MSELAARRVVTQDLAGAVAERLAVSVRAGGHLALAGGSSPRAAYERLAGMSLPWGRCTLWFGDERCVPADDERSNFGMVRSALLGRLREPGPNVERMEGERGPDDGAADYERRLHDAFGPGMPQLDLVLLGIGTDGHCASLFPGGPEAEERDRAVAGVEQAGLEPLVSRITLTLPAINSARAVLFAVAGADKAAVVARAIAGDPQLPSGRVSPLSGDLTFMLDPAAAGEAGPGEGER
jgi:6-phosphogluconolactonase